MPLRLFGGRGSGKGRSCPACEREIAADATFCPSCYLVIRPEGAVELRQHLQGGRIPTDVYLLRKLQAEDPDTGPVVRLAPESPVARPTSGTPLSPVPSPSDGSGMQEVEAPSPVVSSPPQPSAPMEEVATEPATAAQIATGPQPRPRAGIGVHAFLEFAEPFPPPAPTVAEVSALFTWMLERDPLIPNNTELLETIHDSVFRNGPAAHLGYAQHILLQIADDLGLHSTQETLNTHLTLLVLAYRRAAEAYRAAAEPAPDEANAALWQLSSVASRLRVEAWVYRSRHGSRPQLFRSGRPRRRAPKAPMR